MPCLLSTAAGAVVASFRDADARAHASAVFGPVDEAFACAVAFCTSGFESTFSLKFFASPRVAFAPPLMIPRC